MNKRLMCFVYIAVCALIAESSCLSGAGLGAESSWLNEVKNRLSQKTAQTQRIKTLETKANVFDEKNKLVETRNVYIKYPDKVRLDVVNIGTNETLTYIAAGDKNSSNAAFIPVEILVSQLYLILTGQSQAGKISESESGVQELGGTKHFVITFLFGNNIKLTAYMKDSSLSWSRIDIYTLEKEWAKSVELNYITTEDIQQIALPKEIGMVTYNPDQTKSVRRVRVFSNKLDSLIEDKLFEIPAGK